MKHKKIGIVLGGGAARGFAHIGVLKVLLREGIRPDIIVGTSMGAIIASLFAVHMDTDIILGRIREYLSSDKFSKIKFDLLKVADEAAVEDGLFAAVSRYLKKSIFYSVSMTRQSYVSIENYMLNISSVIDDISIQDTRVPLAVICTNINTGEEMVLTEGPLRPAVAASSAIPGIFPPIDFDGRLLVDGGWVDQLPVGPCRKLGANIVIAVDVARKLEQDYSLDNALDILRRTNAITRYTLSNLQAKDADFLIVPEIPEISWADFESFEECVQKGQEAAERSLPAIKHLLKEKTSLVPNFMRKLLGRKL